MIDQLNWMSPAAKKGAYSKIDSVVKNIAYPDWVTDDEKLNNYYKVCIRMWTESNENKKT